MVGVNTTPFRRLEEEKNGFTECYGRVNEKQGNGKLVYL